jgi:hypothetical protein
MNLIVNPNIQSVADLKHTPIRNSTLLTPHISGHTAVFDEAWTTLNVFYIGDLLMENGHWQHIEDINTDRFTIPTNRRHADKGSQTGRPKYNLPDKIPEQD